MWNVLKNVFVRSTRAISRGFVWWFEKLGENPGLARDPGIVAWTTINARKREDDSELFAGELANKESDSDDDGRVDGRAVDRAGGRLQRPPVMRRASLSFGRAVSRRRSLGILHQPTFVPLRYASQRSVRFSRRWERLDWGA